MLQFVSTKPLEDSSSLLRGGGRLRQLTFERVLEREGALVALASQGALGRRELAVEGNQPTGAGQKCEWLRISYGMHLAPRTHPRESGSELKVVLNLAPDPFFASIYLSMHFS